MLDPLRILQRDANDPAVRRKWQLGKRDAVPNFSTGFAGRIDQQRIEHRAPRRKAGISTPCSGLMAT